MAKNISQLQFRKATLSANPCAKYLVNPENVMEWYVLLTGIEGQNDEFVGGQYLLRMELPEADFPYTPPKFYFMTPNGVCKTDTNPCISIGSYHKDAYPATLGVGGFVDNLVSGFIGWRELQGGIDIIITGNHKRDEATIKQFAGESVAYNAKHYQKIIDQILENYNSYKGGFNLTDPKKPRYVTEDIRKKLGLGEFDPANASSSAPASSD